MSIVGKYQLVERQNFDNYLSAAGVGFLKRKAILLLSPLWTFEIDGDKVMSLQVAGPKTIKAVFTAGQAYEHDPGTGRTAKYISTIDGNKLISYEVGQEEPASIQEFTDDGMTMTVLAKGVTGKQIFRRVE